MGTFLGSIGIAHIPEDQQEIYLQRMLRLFREGGMMSGVGVEMFGKKISLLYSPEPDEEGSFRFHYNYFENDFWEDAGMNQGALFSSKVGYKQFCRVMAAAYILRERSADTPCFADIRDIGMPHWFPLGWLKYLFGEELPLERPSIWDTYLTLKTENEYDGVCDSWDRILMRNADSYNDWMDILAIRTVEQGTEETMAEVKEYYEKEASEKEGKGEDQSMAEILEHIKALPEQLPGTEEEQLLRIMAYLTEPDRKELAVMVKKEDEPEALRDLPFMEICLPRQIVVKAVAETYHRDFWELWEKAQAGYAYQFHREVWKKVRKPIEPISTDVYLNITPDDRLFCLQAEELGTLTPHCQEWLEALSGAFHETLKGPKQWADGLAFQRSMLETLSKVQERKSRIWAFRDMFYEFLVNWEQPEYQAMWGLFTQMAAHEETPSAHLRQYLALLANLPLRKAVFGT